MQKWLPLIIALTLLGASCANDDGDNGDCVESKKEDCVVTFEINPVCGCNGVTYENPSTAACHGIENFTMGACD
ncbi:hypothetical protein [Flagellimonas flava]|uniref:Kazal-like domain-containing protein n=1 Tax=Flagellimonas flava TaxID=570519 RepID=A0A1M5IRD4_9FLAO|nr:hypothetical protein [Allomuricauda flava]SHG30530.1 hypothetical protein SAMN04488116_0864 [Allomuricauda flava]